MPGEKFPCGDAVADSQRDAVAPAEAMPLAGVAIAGDLATAVGVPALADADARAAKWVVQGV